LLNWHFHHTGVPWCWGKLEHLPVLMLPFGVFGGLFGCSPGKLMSSAWQTSTDTLT